MISGRAKLAGVAGWPIGHSLSPALHGFWIEEHKLDAAYVPLAIAPGDFKDAFAALPKLGFRGLNVTLPHKEAAFALSTGHDEAARITGAVNTIVFDEGRVLGRNTDVYGFSQLLRDNGIGSLSNRVAVVLGAGGAARAVIASLIGLGAARVVVVNRTLDKAQALAALFGARVVAQEGLAALGEAYLLVNTTSLGMAGQPPLAVDLGAMSRGSAVIDIVYRPHETALLAQAKALGLKAIDGLGMLLHQAQPGFAAWFGVEPKVTPQLRAHLVGVMERG
ncbi:MAG: shikimate dehydrogenase [Alphaproteobacteria bacterium]|nr:shikimate dehydrogenase [Alphaproteobacteria bacterium]